MSDSKIAANILTKQLVMYVLHAHNSLARLNERRAMEVLVEELNKGLDAPVFFVRNDSRYFIMEINEQRILTAGLDVYGKFEVTVMDNINMEVLGHVYDMFDTAIKSHYLKDRIATLKKEVQAIDEHDPIAHALAKVLTR